MKISIENEFCVNEAALGDFLKVEGTYRQIVEDREKGFVCIDPSDGSVGYKADTVDELVRKYMLSFEKVSLIKSEDVELKFKKSIKLK